MYYYEVLVGDLRYHGKSALTYSSETELTTGTVVRISLQNRSVLGIVVRRVPEPTFEAKPIAAVAPAPPLPSSALALIDWLYAYYPAPFGSIVKLFLPPSTVFPKSQTANAEPETQAHASTLPGLTPEQTAALETINAPGYHLLHGITGSGKTRVYAELTQRTLAGEKSVLLLTPEIGLTAQLIDTFATLFPGAVRVLHSRLTNAARRNTWYELLSSEKPLIIIGPRSALFAPVKDIGLIVLDESHDQAYKSETAPYYKTDRVAAQLAHLHKATLISGSATPSLEEYYIAQAKQRPILQLTTQALGTDEKSTVHVVDAKDKTQFVQSPIMSKTLVEAIRRALQAQEQSLLFLNRRGTAAAVVCATCGWRAVCSHCDLALTYHGDTHQMRCHVCGRAHRLPTNCPECHASDILLKTVGTKAVVDEAKRLFPGVRIGRFDTDTQKDEQLEAQLETLRTGAVDIIIGTQMITKGLDLPLLSVVGVLNADASLFIPDYSAAERTFQTLTQVIGRAGRGHRTGTTVIQTYEPASTLMQQVVNRNWHDFYEHELAERKAYRFPPFVYMLKLHCLRATSESAEKAALELKQTLQHTPGIIVEGPAPGFHPRERGKYRWQLVVKSVRRQYLLDIITGLPSGWMYDIDPLDLL